MANPFTELFNQLFGERPQPGVINDQGQIVPNPEPQPQQNPVTRLIEENLTGPLGINAALEQYAQSLGRAQAAQPSASAVQTPVSSEQLTAEADPLQRSQLRAQNRGALAGNVQAQIAEEILPHIVALVETGGAYWDEMPPDVQEAVTRGANVLMGAPITNALVPQAEAALAGEGALGQLAATVQGLVRNPAEAPRSYSEVEGIDPGLAIALDVITGLPGGAGELVASARGIGAIEAITPGRRFRLFGGMDDDEANQVFRQMADEGEIIAPTREDLLASPMDEGSARAIVSRIKEEVEGIGARIDELAEEAGRRRLTDAEFQEVEAISSREVDLMEMAEAVDRTFKAGGNVTDFLDELRMGGASEEDIESLTQWLTGFGPADAMEDLRLSQAFRGQTLMENQGLATEAGRAVDIQPIPPEELRPLLESGEADRATWELAIIDAMDDMRLSGMLPRDVALDVRARMDALAESGMGFGSNDLLAILDNAAPEYADDILRIADEERILNDTTKIDVFQNRIDEARAQGAEIKIDPETGEEFIDWGEVGAGEELLADGKTTVDDVANDPRLAYQIWASQVASRFQGKHLRILREEGPEALIDELTLGPTQADPEFAQRYVAELSQPRQARDELAGIIGEDSTVLNLLKPDESGLIEPEAAINALVAKNKMDRTDAMSLVFRYLNETYNASGPMDDLTMLGAAGLTEAPLARVSPLAAGEVDDVLPYDDVLDLYDGFSLMVGEGAAELSRESILAINRDFQDLIDKHGEGATFPAAEVMEILGRYFDESQMDQGLEFAGDLAQRRIKGEAPTQVKFSDSLTEDEVLRMSDLSRMGEGELSGINEADVEPGDLDELMIQARMWHERSGTDESFGNFLDRMAGDEVSFEDMLDEAGLSREEGVAGEVAGPAREPDPLAGKSVDLFEALDASEVAGMESRLPDFQQIAGVMQRKAASKGLDSNLVRGIASTLSEMDDPAEARELLGNYFTPMEVDEILGGGPNPLGEAAEAARHRPDPMNDEEVAEWMNGIMAERDPLPALPEEATESIEGLLTSTDYFYDQFQAAGEYQAIGKLELANPNLTSDEIEEAVRSFRIRDGEERLARAASEPTPIPVNSFGRHDRFTEWVDPSLLVGEASGNPLRRSPERIQELIDDIRENGFGEPVEVHYSPAEGRYMVAEGNHRVQAAIELGIPVPVRVRLWPNLTANYIYGGEIKRLRLGADLPGQPIHPDRHGSVVDMPKDFQPSEIGLPTVDPPPSP